VTGAEVLFDVRDGVAAITLNRPGALNALTSGMVAAMTGTLAGWAMDPGIKAVVLAGAGQRGLCAGGDVRLLFEQATTGRHAEAREFWRAEYLLIAFVARLRVPYVALMHGIVMGGGIGISAHGRHRVVTETSRLALPEVGIGFTPDVGGTLLLSRAPGQLGTHVALTAAHLNAGDAIDCGLADCYIPSARLTELTMALAKAPAADVLAAFSEEPPPGTLAGHRDWIDHCYAADSVEEILGRLDSRTEAAAAEAAAALRRHSPTALKVTLRALRDAGRLGTLERALSAEYRIMAASLGSHDFREGIRAQLIDRDRNPRWSPSSLAGVVDGAVASYFLPLGDGELTFGPATHRGSGSRPAGKAHGPSR
jgi:enoyl-CoA hydratase/carnithine racemase